MAFDTGCNPVFAKLTNAEVAALEAAIATAYELTDAPAGAEAAAAERD